MKRSLHVTAPLLASTAFALLAGCRSPQMQRCVDEQNRVVDDSFCKANPQNLQDQPRNANPFIPRYRFYYGGSGGYVPGTFVTGGGYTPMSGVRYSTGTTRGGFGSTHGGGEGGEGGGAHGGGSGGE